jgi:hypothetical protein
MELECFFSRFFMELSVFVNSSFMAIDPGFTARKYRVAYVPREMNAASRAIFGLQM